MKAKHKSTQKFYALKVIDKSFIINNDKKDIIMNERSIMIKNKHPFVANMDFAFQSVII